MLTLLKSKKLTIKVGTSHRFFSYRTWGIGTRLPPDHNTKGLNLFFLGLVIGFTVRTTIPTE